MNLWTELICELQLITLKISGFWLGPKLSTSALSGLMNLILPGGAGGPEYLPVEYFERAWLPFRYWAKFHIEVRRWLMILELIEQFNLLIAGLIFDCDASADFDRLILISNVTSMWGYSTPAAFALALSFTYGNLEPKISWTSHLTDSIHLTKLGVIMASNSLQFPAFEVSLSAKWASPRNNIAWLSFPSWSFPSWIPTQELVSVPFPGRSDVASSVVPQSFGFRINYCRCFGWQVVYLCTFVVFSLGLLGLGFQLELEWLSHVRLLACTVTLQKRLCFQTWVSYDKRLWRSETLKEQANPGIIHLLFPVSQDERTMTIIVFQPSTVYMIDSTVNGMITPKLWPICFNQHVTRISFRLLAGVFGCASLHPYFGSAACSLVLWAPFSQVGLSQGARPTGRGPFVFFRQLFCGSCFSQEKKKYVLLQVN